MPRSSTQPDAPTPADLNLPDTAMSPMEASSRVAQSANLPHPEAGLPQTQPTNAVYEALTQQEGVIPIDRTRLKMLNDRQKVILRRNGGTGAPFVRLPSGRVVSVADDLAFAELDKTLPPLEEDRPETVIETTYRTRPTPPPTQAAANRPRPRIHEKGQQENLLIAAGEYISSSLYGRANGDVNSLSDRFNKLTMKLVHEFYARTELGHPRMDPRRVTYMMNTLTQAPNLHLIGSLMVWTQGMTDRLVPRFIYQLRHESTCLSVIGIANHALNRNNIASAESAFNCWTWTALFRSIFDLTAAYAGVHPTGQPNIETEAPTRATPAASDSEIVNLPGSNVTPTVVAQHLEAEPNNTPLDYIEQGIETPGAPLGLDMTFDDFDPLALFDNETGA